MKQSAKGTALVTGATRRIGFVLASRLAAEGYDVALHTSARSRAETEIVAARVSERGVRTAVIVCDLADPKACEHLVADAVSALGPLDLLVNNASSFEADEASAIDLAVWDRHFAVNLRAPVILSQHFAAQARPGLDAAIVNLIDQRVLRPTPLFFSYTLSKSALWTATITMAQAFAERGVRVNAIGPGPVLPNAMDGDAGFSREIEGVPLRRAVEPEDLAATVLYLAAAKGVTGQLIAVDAGQHLAWRTPDIVG
jgi:NAD(P)-dependent dehydrogenase (short-subunit alcohol dehydrogenase family)